MSTPLYCDHTKFRVIIPDKIVDRLTNNVTTPDDLIDKISLYADEIINDALDGIYTLPFNPVPETIENIAITITAYKLCERWGKGNPYADAYKEAMDLLKQIVEGMDIFGIKAQKTSGEYVRKVHWPDYDLDYRADLHRRHH